MYTLEDVYKTFPSGCTEDYKILRAFEMGKQISDKKVRELEQQIEKMKNCKNCANYMISGKCPSFFRTGWCKNWEMTKGVKND